MLFGDNMFVGNTAVDAAYLGNTQVWSAIPADVKAHIARVTADGGTVPEQAKMVSMVKKLIAANLWNNCVFFGLPLGGVKKDGNQFVSKVYDLKTNADLLQATGTAQPKYQTDGSLLYDGGDYVLSSALNAGTPIRNITTNCTVIMTASTLLNGITKILISRFGETIELQPWQIYINTTGRIVVDSKGIGGSRLVFITDYTIQSDVPFTIGFTFDGNEIDVNNRLKVYINGVIATGTLIVTGDLRSLIVCNTPVTIGARYSDRNYKLPNGSKSSLHQIYNSTLIAEQMLWNYNNIKVEV